MGAETEYTIDELARVADTTVRSVRVYHERGLLPSPDVRGRIGYYGTDHVSRLQTISRLLGRGMKLNGIRELLDAWDRGDGLADVLGVPVPEEPQASPVPELPDYAKEALAATGDALSTFRITNPRASDLINRLVEAGFRLEDALGTLESLRLDCDQMIDRYAADLIHCLAGQGFENSARTPQDRTKYETDLAIARLIATRATTELIDQAFARHIDQFSAAADVLPAESVD
ncbi:MerR family transcriptional regulator [Nocardia panacis]|uniref:MerR family transcriptional regulator n=1 Tax=Nocardia panacis TaxID=2340916 RepID=A0A3A4KQ92_9NOCA|nr:MerR family transcriptional regulator [Nocardia panacis]RJO79873.1 MerR family transcriptional regulator [Nocardia panacis]